MSVADRIKERKKFITDMLVQAHGCSVLGADIRKAVRESFGKEISKATLSSDIKALISEGYEIISDTDGYRLIEAAAQTAGTDIFAPTTSDTVAQWYILVILSDGYDRYMSAQDICEEFGELTGGISLSSVKEHLRSLEERKYISRHTRQEVWAAGQTSLSDAGEGDNKLFYHITDSAPVLSFIDKETVMDFNAYYYDGGYTGELEGTLKKINDKLAAASPGMYAEGSGAYKSSAKKVDIPEEINDKLNVLLELPFRKYALGIKYREKENVREYIFKTAMIIFNVETNSFYLLGEIRSKRKWQRKNLKLGAVVQMQAEESIYNDIYESKKYRDIFAKMWSAAPDEPCDTEVLFEDTPDVREEIDGLKQTRRETAMVSHIKAKDGTRWLSYKDSIMGTHDFLKFVRSEGASAVIIKPEKSRKHLIEKTKEMAEGYKEILKRSDTEK